MERKRSKESKKSKKSKVEDAEGSFVVELENVVPVDQYTFNTLATFPGNFVTAPLEMTFRICDKEAAIAIHKLTNRINDKPVKDTFVANSVYLDIPSVGPARIFYARFFRRTFKEWSEELLENEKDVIDAKITKVFRSIVRAIDVLHRHNVWGIELKSSIRIDDDDFAQIVLQTTGKDSMKDGVHEDVKDFKKLVKSVYKIIGEDNSVGYKLFVRICKLLSKRSDVNGENNSLRSYSYFILHNALFYEVGDRYNFLYKMKMIRDMDRELFQNQMSSLPEIADWQTHVEKEEFEDHFVREAYNYYWEYYDTPISILLLYYNCHKHYQQSRFDALEVQKEMDIVFPEVVYHLFFYFVKNIESLGEFKNCNVLDYFEVVLPCTNFLT